MIDGDGNKDVSKEYITEKKDESSSSSSDNDDTGELLVITRDGDAHNPVVVGDGSAVGAKTRGELEPAVSGQRTERVEELQRSVQKYQMRRNSWKQWMHR